MVLAKHLQKTDTQHIPEQSTLRQLTREPITDGNRLFKLVRLGNGQEIQEKAHDELANDADVEDKQKS